MTYKEQLLDPRWQKKRLEILNRDKWMCQHCYESSKTLMVHHTYYEKGIMAWEAKNEYLVTLCNDCHLECHEKIPEYHKKIIDQFKIKLPDSWINGCAVELFTEIKDVNSLIYMLWEAKERESELLTLLRDFIFPDSYDISDPNETKIINAEN